MKKSTLAILAALAIGAGSLQADDLWRQQQRRNEFNQRQAQWQAEFDRDWQEHEQRRNQRRNERHFQDLEDRINRSIDFDFE